MIIKWIKCQVPNHKKVPFSEAQSQWIKLKGTKGFLGQIGGWNLINENEACVLGFWHDMASYNDFMRTEHDKIFKHNNQNKTYDHISVLLFETMLHIGHRDLVTALSKGSFVRVEDCLVNQDKQHHFVDVQKTIWNKVMEQSPGMLSRVFCQRNDKANHYVVISIWNNNQYHDRYVEQHIHFLKRQAELNYDLIEITDHAFHFEQAWTVF